LHRYVRNGSEDLFWKARSKELPVNRLEPELELDLFNTMLSGTTKSLTPENKGRQAIPGGVGAWCSS
jgi:hypothetical protein